MKTRENELHEPKITTEVKENWYLDYFDKKTQHPLYKTMANCPVCGFYLDFSYGISLEETIDKVKFGSKYNYCPNCGARLKESVE